MASFDGTERTRACLIILSPTSRKHQDKLVCVRLNRDGIYKMNLLIFISKLL